MAIYSYRRGGVWYCFCCIAFENPMHAAKHWHNCIAVIKLSPGSNIKECDSQNQNQLLKLGRNTFTKAQAVFCIVPAALQIMRQCIPASQNEMLIQTIVL